MSNNAIIKSAVIGGLATAASDRPFMLSDLEVRLARINTTRLEMDETIAQLVADGVVGLSGEYRDGLVRGPRFREQAAPASGPTFNFGGSTFHGDAQVGVSNTKYEQINETDASQLVSIIEALINKPDSKEKARPILEAFKDGTIETASKVIAELIKAFGGAPPAE